MGEKERKRVKKTDEMDEWMNEWFQTIRICSVLSDGENSHVECMAVNVNAKVNTYSVFVVFFLYFDALNVAPLKTYRYTHGSLPPSSRYTSPYILVSYSNILICQSYLLNGFFRFGIFCCFLFASLPWRRSPRTIGTFFATLCLLSLCGEQHS